MFNQQKQQRSVKKDSRLPYGYCTSLFRWLLNHQQFRTICYSCSILQNDSPKKQWLGRWFYKVGPKTSDKWSSNPFISRRYPCIRPFLRVITPLIAGKGPPCRGHAISSFQPDWSLTVPLLSPPFIIWARSRSGHDIPLYWLVNRDPYIKLTIIPELGSISSSGVLYKVGPLLIINGVIKPVNGRK